MTTSPVRERRRIRRIVTLEQSTARTPATSPTTSRPRRSRTSMPVARARATSATTDPVDPDHGPTPLERLVVDPATFAEQVWGRIPLVERGRDDLVDLLSLDDVDAFISRGVRRPAVRMVRAGTVLDPAVYCTATRLGGQSVPKVVDGLKVAEQIAAGAT